MPWFYYFTREIIRLFFILLTRYRVKGQDNVPKQGPLMVVANHLSLADPPLLGISLGREAYFMAKQELFSFKPLAGFIAGLGCFPVSRRRLDRRALSRAVRVLENDQVLAMFPEGSRSRNQRLKVAYPGAALIASRLGVPILPVGISGTERLRGMAWLLRRPEVRVDFGTPFHLPPADGRLTKQRLAEFTDIIMGRIARQLPPKYHGHYAERKS